MILNPNKHKQHQKLIIMQITNIIKINIIIIINKIEIIKKKEKEEVENTVMMKKK
jgi:hypothetical protein